MPVDTIVDLDIARLVGSTFTGDVKWSDGSKAVFGTDSDVDISWDNAASLLDVRNGTTEVMTFSPSAPKLDIIFPSAGSSNLPALALYQDRSTHTAFVFDDVAELMFDAKSSTGARRTYGKIRSEVTINTNGDEGGRLALSAISAGAQTDFMYCLGVFAAIAGGAAVEFPQNFGGVSGKALLVQGNTYAFRYDSLLGGVHTPTNAGIQFSVGTPSGFEFFDTSSQQLAIIPAVGRGGIECPVVVLNLSTERTIDASGQIGGAAGTQISSSRHTVDTANDDASDNLDTIASFSGNPLRDGQLLILRAEHTDRTVVVRHNVGNIVLDGGVDCILDNTRDRLVLVYDASLSLWCELTRSDNGA